MEEVIIEERHDGIVLDHDHPWPGLVSFTETDHGFFFGREREVQELARLVKQETLTVFFGKSGLGKSSILRAGLSPLLRESDFVPVYIRLNHAEGAPPLEDQVEIFIEGVLEREQIDAPRPVRAETLWEYFHKKGNDWWDTENRLLRPILIFDQFEELLTLGQENPVRAGRTASFLAELEDLVENRPPEALLARFKEDRELADKFDHRRCDYRVILALREDFLPDLEGLRERLRSIMLNRLRLMPMNGEQALAVVLKPGSDLVEEEVAVRIVDFVSSSERSRLQAGVTRAQLAKRAIEPALLSVVLQELNSRRIKAGQKKITAELVGKTSPTEIFDDFYQRGLKGMKPAVRHFIEDCLLTSSGARNRMAEEDALTKPDITEDVLARLIDRRIIQRETVGAIKWLELTHDTLADVVRADRAEHSRQREVELARARELKARRELSRAQKLVVAFGFLLLITVGALWLLGQRIESQAGEIALAVRAELEAPAADAPSRVNKSITRLSEERGHYPFLGDLKLAHGRALAYGAQVLFFNGWIQKGCRYSEKAVETLDRLKGDPAVAIDRANAYYARAQGHSLQGQLPEAERDFLVALEIAKSLPEGMARDRAANRIRILANLGLGEVKSEGGARSEAEKIFNQVLAEVGRLFPKSPQKEDKNNAEATIYEVAALQGLGKIAEWSGRLDEDLLKETNAKARDFLAEADRKISQTITLDPDNVALQNARAEVAYGRVFFLLNRNWRSVNYAPIAIRLRDALANGEKLPNLDQRNRRWKWLLAQDYRLEGMLQQRVGDDKRALKSFEKMRSLASEIQQSEPSWLHNNYSLPIAEFYMADCVSALASKEEVEPFDARLSELSDRGNFGKAAASLRETLAQIGKTGEPSSRPQRGAEAVADFRLQVYRAVRDKLDQLIRDAPGNVSYERTRAVVNNSIGDRELLRDRISEAIAAYQNGLKIIQSMPAEARQLPDVQLMKTELNKSLGGALLKETGPDKKRLALQSYREELEDLAHLAKSRESVSNLASLASANIDIGDVYLGTKDKEKALEAYQAAIRVYDDALKATSKSSSRSSLLLNKAYGLRYIAARWRDAGDLTMAASWLTPAITAALEVFQNDPLSVGTFSFLDELKGSDKNPGWEKYCEDLRQRPQLDEASKKSSHTILDALKKIPPSLLPPGAVTKDRKIAAVPTSQNWDLMPLIVGSWHNLVPEEQAREVQNLRRSEMIDPNDEIPRIRTLAIPFYPETQLFEAEVKRNTVTIGTICYVRRLDPKSDGENINRIRLDGHSDPIHRFNSAHRPNLDDEVWAAAYLRFFLAGIQFEGTTGSFRIIDSEADLHWDSSIPAEVRATARSELQKVIFPLQIQSTAQGWVAKATVTYSNRVFYVLLQLWPDGRVEMSADEPVAADLPVIPECWQDGFRVVSARSAAFVEKVQAGDLAVKEKNWPKAIEDMTAVINLLPEDQRGNVEFLTSLYLNLSWSQLQTRDFSGALRSAETGLKSNKTSLPLETNHAHALLFLGRIAEAEAIYRKHVGEKIGTGAAAKSWEEVILDDFDQLEKNGLGNPEFDRIRKILKAGAPKDQAK